MPPKEQQRYRVVERLAAGGMAEVFIAESAGIEGFKKQVAIKRVLPHLSKKEGFIAMFLDEARLSAQLSHSNVAQVFDIGVGDESYFIVMEFVDGADLKQVMKHLRDTNRPFPIEAAVYIAIKICEGLAYAHEKQNADGESLNVVHRDISPPNVLISKHGEVKIVDFGLAKASTQLEKSEAGIIKGKFAYLSPEAAHGKEVDSRSDIFAVGIILWEMLAGKRLFIGSTDYQTVKAVQTADFQPVSELCPEADAHLDSILSRALARLPEKRYQSARALGRDLSRWLFRQQKPVSSFDISELVRGTLAQRSLKKTAASEGVSIIDKLISETLLQFTSLADESKKGGPDGEVKVDQKPLSLAGFAEFANWADEAEQRQSELLVKNTLPAAVFEEGNLAALEGDEPILPSGGSPSDHDSLGPLASLEDEPAPLKNVIPSAAPPPISSVPPPKEGGTNTVVKAFLLVVIAAGTAAAVWFSGILQ